MRSSQCLALSCCEDGTMTVRLRSSYILLLNRKLPGPHPAAERLLLSYPCRLLVGILAHRIAHHGLTQEAACARQRQVVVLRKRSGGFDPADINQRLRNELREGNVQKPSVSEVAQTSDSSGPARWTGSPLRQAPQRGCMRAVAFCVDHLSDQMKLTTRFERSKNFMHYRGDDLATVLRQIHAMMATSHRSRMDRW